MKLINRLDNGVKEIFYCSPSGNITYLVKGCGCYEDIFLQIETIDL